MPNDGDRHDAKHFIAKITPGGGPSPLIELNRLVAQADENEEHTAWFATRKPGAGWEQSPVSRCLIIAAGVAGPGGGIRAVHAQIRRRQDSPPANHPVVRELYPNPDDYQGWWLLGDPIYIDFQSIADIPGCHRKSKRSYGDTFSGSVSFAYWDFGSEDIDLFVHRVDEDDTPPAATAVDAPRQPRPPGPPRSAAAELPKWKLPLPNQPIWGVDFSGGQESPQGNRKIWIAGWDSRNGLTLRCGQEDGMPPIRRTDLPQYIIDRPGWWALDFPFGIAQGTACAAGFRNWNEWLTFCHNTEDASRARNSIRQRTQGNGVTWSLRRGVDTQHGTTWFPLFEQLYRQTIYGVGQVLYRLNDTPRDQCCVLPWHWNDYTMASSIIVEGFPGVTLRKRLSIPPHGYKRNTADGAIVRTHIVNCVFNLIGRESLGNCDHIANRAVADTEGDAVDALVLLLAAWISQAQTAGIWKGQFERLRHDNLLVEGWFPA